MPQIRNSRSLFLYAVMCASGLISAFFAFYTIRLLYVTEGLTVIRAGGGGTYIGAVAFPVLAIVFAFVTWRLLKAARKHHSVDIKDGENV